MSLETIDQGYLSELKRRMTIERARRQLLAFTLYTKPDYQVNWHHRLTCQYLNRFVNREITRLMVLQPPGHGKSELTSRRLPAFLHGIYPDDEIMAASYSANLARDMTADVQRIMDGPEYQEIFPGSKITPPGSRDPVHDRNMDEHHVVRRLGKYRGQGIGGSFTGKRAAWILIDDPIKGRQEADSPAFRKFLGDFYNNDLRNRLRIGGGSILLTQTCWHQDDLAHRLQALAQADPNADQWTVVKLPALREDLSNREDPRELGGVLWPEAFPLKELLAMKSGDPRGFSALFQQRPTLPESSLFKREWWKRHDVVPTDVIRKAMFIDCANKVGISNDYTVMATWAETPQTYYLTRLWRKKVTFPDLVRACIDQYHAERPHAVVIEDAANGTPLIQELRAKTTLPVVVWPCENKVIKATRAQPTVESGRCSLPKNDPNVGDFIDEHEIFPNGTNDDTVDTTGMMCDYFRNDKPKPSIRFL